MCHLWHEISCCKVIEYLLDMEHDCVHCTYSYSAEVSILTLQRCSRTPTQPTLCRPPHLSFDPVRLEDQTVHQVTQKKQSARQSSDIRASNLHSNLHSGHHPVA